MRLSWLARRPAVDDVVTHRVPGAGSGVRRHFRCEGDEQRCTGDGHIGDGDLGAGRIFVRHRERDRRADAVRGEFGIAHAQRIECRADGRRVVGQRRFGAQRLRVAMSRQIKRVDRALAPSRNMRSSKSDEAPGA